MLDGDKNEFFREATIRLCRDLAVEKALREGIRYINRFIPVDVIYLETLHARTGGVRAIAKATATNAEALDLLIPLPSELTSEISSREKMITQADHAPVRVFNHPSEDPAAHALLEMVGAPLDASILALSFAFEQELAGNVIFVTHGTDRYTSDHVELLSLLREPFRIAMANALRHREVLRLRDRLTDENRFLHRELWGPSGERIVGAEFGLRLVMEMVEKVAPLESPVLILGETGVGKDLIARAIHRRSERRTGPFVAVNCGAIPDSLVDSELFGHEKGAFTGAFERKLGRLERASGGTIFLDEVGELPPSAQVKLLRVLQNHEIERVGGSETIAVDLRVVSATHRDLREMVRSGTFREDLLFRLNLFPIEIPSLRARRNDIAAFADHFMELKAKELKWTTTPTLSRGAIEMLRTYDWPGNVRELENVIERAMILQRDRPLSFDALIDPRDVETTDGVSLDDGPPSQTLDEVDAAYIRRVLKHCEGKIQGTGGAADILGLNPSTLRSRMKKLGIPFGIGG